MDMERSESRYDHHRDDSPLRGKDRKKSGEKDHRSSKDRDKDRKDRGKEKDREKESRALRDRERERERERAKHREREKGKEKSKEKEKPRYRQTRKDDDDDKAKLDDGGDFDDTRKKDRDVKQDNDESGQIADDGLAPKNVARPTTSELENRILKMKEERTKKKSEDGSDVLSWVGKIRKIEAKKNVEKQKALQMSKLLEEQDNIVQEESDDDNEETAQHHNLAGVKVLNGIDKVMEGGAVVLTLKDQNILADGDVNEDVDMLENVEIGEQKRRDDAYKAAKKKAGTYEDKFNDDPSAGKKMLPQYDEPDKDEGITLDEKGRIAVEAEKRLEELRRRLNGTSSNSRLEDLNVPGKVSSDYFTPEEMLKFKKPKKKKALRKKDKLDIDALEAEAVSAGLGVGDLGSRNDSKRRAMKEEQDRAEAERRDKAYQAAYVKADEASKSLRLEQTLRVKSEEEEDVVFADDDEDLYKSLERARKIALKKKEEAPYGPEAVARLATTITASQTEDEQDPESQGNRVVLSEMEEFVWSLQLGEETQKPDDEDVFMEEDEEPKVSEEEVKDEPGGWSEVKDTEMEENPSNEQDEEIVPDEIIHEAAVGKGLSGALKLLQDRGALKETVEWGGRNMDKKKSKLVGIVDDDEPKKTQQTRQKVSKELVYHEKDIRIERTDEFGRILTPKEAFRILSHKFHGKGPGKMKQEKRMKQFQEELKLKQMKSSDTPSMSVERMREAQAQLKTPYLVLSGHVKPGQTSDPQSGYATVEKDLPGGLTPMLGDRKVEHFLGIKRKPEPSNLGPSKKPKP